MSALPPKADMGGATRDVRFGPKADIKPVNFSARLCSLKRRDPERDSVGANAKARFAPSDVPTPMFGHPAIGSTVARHIADAWERKVITEH